MESQGNRLGRRIKIEKKRPTPQPLPIGRGVDSNEPPFGEAFVFPAIPGLKAPRPLRGGARGGVFPLGEAGRKNLLKSIKNGFVCVHNFDFYQESSRF